MRQTEVLEDIHLKICSNWVDDCLVYGKTPEEFLDNLDTVLTRFSEKEVKLNFDKCIVYAPKIEWCGREISEDGGKGLGL